MPGGGWYGVVVGMLVVALVVGVNVIGVQVVREVGGRAVGASVLPVPSGTISGNRNIQINILFLF